MTKTTKIVLGLPWYGGPDIDCYPGYFEMMCYLGRMRERSIWFDMLSNKLNAVPPDFVAELPPLDPWALEAELTEITPADGVFEFYIANQTRLSLPGLARERLVEMALQVGADYLFMWDADMRFPWSTLLRLWRHQKPVVNALGFTSRDPVMPCLYKIMEGYDVASRSPSYDSEVIYDYPKKGLIGSEDIGGSIAFGAGVTLINMNVFKQIPKPWFNSTGCGEDWFFCVRCHTHGIPRYVDTTIPLLHKAHKVNWYGAEHYQKERERIPDTYAKMARREVID